MPPSERRVLVLGGTSEGRELADWLAARGVYAVTSLAGATRQPRRPAGPVRTGGFGGPEGLAAWLRAERMEAVVDATHPFARRISENARLACEALGLPRLRLERPAWTPEPGDVWVEAESPEDAAERLPALGTRVFLALGSQGLEPFGRLEGMWFLVRSVEPAPLRLPGETLLARGPFGLEEERALLQAHRIQVVVCKASGGEASRSKVRAAGGLGLPVLMIRRPPPVPGLRVAEVREAWEWVRALPGAEGQAEASGRRTCRWSGA